MSLSITVLIAALTTTGLLTGPGSKAATATDSNSQVDPTVLVARLGSPRFRDRERAARDLETLGLAALPALRAAKTTRDPEIQTRAGQLRERIERVLMLRPSLVLLNSRERPLNEIVGSLGSQSRVKVGLEGHNLFQGWPKATVVETKPLPFWDALDRVCRAGNVRRSLASGQGPGDEDSVSGESAGIVMLNELPKDKVLFPSYNHGPFQVRLVKFRRDREVSLDQKDDEPTDRFQAVLAIAAEPRLAIGLEGLPQLLEAIDDRGRSLKPADLPKDDDANDPDIAPGIPFDMPQEVAGDQTISIALQIPKGNVHAIAVLRGTVPIGVAGLREDPLTIPLTDATGKTFRDGDLSVTVQSVKNEADGSSIDILLRDDSEANDRNDRNGQRVNFMPQTILRQLILVDDKNRRLAWMPDNFDGESGAHQITLKTMPALGRGAPVRLLVHGLIRAKTDVPFEFRDLRRVP